MKSALFLLITMIASSLWAKTIVIRPGVEHELTRTEFHRLNQATLTFKCESEPKCKIDYEYVGKKFSLKMPNGKNFAFYKTKKEAMSAAGELVSAKICDRVVLNIESKEVVQN